MSLGYHRRPVPAVGAFIIRDGEILLIRRGCEPAIGKWSVPGGSMEWGEAIEEAVKREVLEETGLLIRVGDFIGLSELVARDEKTNEITFHYILLNYLGEVISGEMQAATDAADVRWVPLSEVKTLDCTLSVVKRLEDMGLV